MKAVAKCANYSGCLVAHKGTAIELADGQPAVCPECGRPLAVTQTRPPARMKTVAIIAVVAALAIGGAVALRELRKRRVEAAQTTADARRNDLENRPPAAEPGPDSATTPVADAAPAAEDAPIAAPRADNTSVTDEVRNEVLKRIDAMPIARDKKDKLYASVLRAKEMRRIMVVPFGSGGRTLPPRERAALKALVGTPEIMKVRGDLTAVFVVLGFADSKGDEQANLAISADRAKHVKEFLVGSCGVTNLTQDVAMGGSKLVDEERLEKNRIVEVWTVLP